MKPARPESGSEVLVALDGLALARELISASPHMSVSEIGAALEKLHIVVYQARKTLRKGSMRTLLQDGTVRCALVGAMLRDPAGCCWRAPLAAAPPCCSVSSSLPSLAASSKRSISDSRCLTRGTKGRGRSAGQS